MDSNLIMFNDLTGSWDQSIELTQPDDFTVIVQNPTLTIGCPVFAIIAQPTTLGTTNGFTSGQQIGVA